MPFNVQKRLGETLRDLRLASRKSQAGVAQELGVSRSTVTQMELGKRTLKAEDVGRLARVYGCSTTALLAAPQPDARRNGDELIADLLQTVPELAGDKTALEALRDALAVTRALTGVESLVGLETYSSGPPAHAFGSATTPWEGAHQGYVAAYQERSRIGLGDAPIRDLDDTLALMRVRATKTPLPEGTLSLFLHDRDTGFLVIANRALSLVERRFQYAHAYAHALFDRAHRWLVCRADDRHSVIEVRASAFASRFLLPEDGLKRYLHSLGKDTLGWSTGSVLNLPVDHAGSTARQERVLVQGRGRRGATPITACDLAQIASYFGVTRRLVAYNLRNLRSLSEQELAALERHDAEGILERARQALDPRGAAIASGRDAFRRRLLGLAVEALSRRAIDAQHFTELVSLVGLTQQERQALVDTIRH